MAREGRGVANAIDSIPNMTAAQRAELATVNEELSSQAAAVTAARNALAAAAFAEPRNPAAIPIMAGAVREAELAFVMAHANALAQIQASSNRLSPDQVAAWKIVAGSTPGRTRRAWSGHLPDAAASCRVGADEHGSGAARAGCGRCAKRSA